MSKFVLEIEEEYDFSLIGISCHHKDYRLCWELNKVMEIHLNRVDDYVIENTKFPFYEFLDDDNYLDYYLIGNRSGVGYLIPEQKKVDYFMLLKGNTSDELVSDIICKINSISLVLTSFNVDPNQLKSKANLLF